MSFAKYWKPTRGVKFSHVSPSVKTARTRTTYNDIKIREFKTITGVVSFLIGIGFSHADVPLEEGQRTTHKLAASDTGGSK